MALCTNTTGWSLLFILNRRAMTGSVMQPRASSFGRGRTTRVWKPIGQMVRVTNEASDEEFIEAGLRVP